MFHVNMHRLAYSSAHVTIFLTDNANVCWNSSAIQKEAIFFNCVHFIESLQVFLVFMMLVNVV